MVLCKLCKIKLQTRFRDGREESTGPLSGGGVRCGEGAYIKLWAFFLGGGRGLIVAGNKEYLYCQPELWRKKLGSGEICQEYMYPTRKTFINCVETNMISEPVKFHILERDPGDKLFPKGRKNVLVLIP